ncbi:hypothetical protein [Sulfurimonas autotrophica]|uniref:Uncharacterized protein n=1 Tax=Sulfurimonas autotrophica (strain ATCC BAA-671 / DSM 16294 / JCM 11897 / OK10) TaxID=563040 RepID=E0UUY8_SULAO|nr:hypothetical protein [Sulfurimonas autotrophica]ADN08500.1 hypothetical protein Saut_0451 [Sulfurimonas autotrophica DSM 16294]
MREKIDLFEEKFQSLNKNEKTALLIFIPFAVIILFYFLYISNAIDEKKSNDMKLTKINHDLNKYSVKKILNKIQSSKQEILQVKSKIAEDEQKLKYLDSALSKSHFLFLSQKDFNIFLNNLLAKSVKNNILLDDVNISKKDDDFIGKLKYKKNVKVTGHGEFLNVLSFIRKVEENSMLMQIKNLSIETDGTVPYVSYDINFYGIKK